MAEGSGKSTTGRSDAEVRDALSLVAKAEKAAKIDLRKSSSS